MLALLALAATQQPILRLLLQQDADGVGAPAGSFLNSSNYVNKVGTQIFAVNGTNVWLDFGLTNDSGPIVYQTLIATNNVNFLGPTNAEIWRLISLNVFASGADRTLSIPTNLPHLNTNGLILGGSTFRLVLTNGNEFRITLQSNLSLSTLWTTFGQGAPRETNGFAPPTNSPTDGYSIHATGLLSKWSPDLNLTNSRVTGYIPYATGSDAKWDSPPAANGSNNVLQSLFSYPVAYISGAGNYDFNLFFANFGNVILSTWQSDGTKTLRVNVPINGWSSSSANQIETHQILLIGSGSNNTALSFPQAIWLDGTTPANLATNEAWLITIRHIYNQTNWVGSANHVTNANAFIY